MDALKFFKEYNRMCSSTPQCGDCPITGGAVDSCDSYLLSHPEEVVPIIEKWSAEHPIMTNALKFKEVFGVELNLFNFTPHLYPYEVLMYGNTDIAKWLSEPYKEPKP